MCGLAALFAYGADAPAIDTRALSATNDAMARRGPDGQGQWLSSDQRVGFAHRRLAIIDLSDNAAQPMIQDGPAGRLAITYNGEIYNFLELREQLAVGDEPLNRDNPRHRSPGFPALAHQIDHP